ncbi:anti-sigma B factor antagonist [Actinokineospora alba]|uniref:Anti-sigma factor antagonist n=1 Tax=Actinokineospora alba TaxID=504798 RepID=A0A1H0EVA7_9PSEU|nr:STAS domain-containing protein [Actinokineospora alba]TDP69237.1 anti-sigma B factor antagonist [Actinokineospora alba]SDI21244.1 anti-sigma B factor antagonist [Actinokineospora alba]SDN86321.1 anti-sigma B factor antagonist [Actinokineospora alba]
MVDIVDPRGTLRSNTDGAGPLTVTVTLRRAGLVVLTSHGEIDLYTAPILREAMAAQEKVARMVLDLAAIEFCGVAGARVLDEGADRARDHGGRLSLVVATVGVRRLLQLTGLDRRVPTYPDLSTALFVEGLGLAPTGSEEDAGESPVPP